MFIIIAAVEFAVLRRARPTRGFSVGVRRNDHGVIIFLESGPLRATYTVLDYSRNYPFVRRERS